METLWKFTFCIQYFIPKETSRDKRIVYVTKQFYLVPLPTNFLDIDDNLCATTIVLLINGNDQSHTKPPLINALHVKYN